MSMLRKIQRVGKRATKFQYTATYQSVVVECLRDRWRPNKICVSWTRKGRRLITKMRPWQQSPDNNARGVVIWPEPEIVDITVTLYKGPKDKSYETKEWEFAVIDVDANGKRKVLATTSINMVRYASSMPYDHDLHLRLKPTSRKIKTVMLEVSLTSKFLKEGKATDDDMISLASMMSVSNLSTIGFLEDEDDDYYWTGGRSVTPPMIPQNILSTDQLLKWSQEVTENVPSVKITNMTTSWRSGLGFLAIILYYRPDLVPDFDMLSPNTLKENNILAFEIARSLGIACTLTPNMMVTATVPDKLAVTSFVYQMYQYFTKATQSAITRQNSRNVGSGANSPTGDLDKKSPSSPFDIKNFDLFATRNSPVTTPPADTNKVKVYSRHSRDESQSEVQLEQPSRRSPRSISPILAQGRRSPHGSTHEEVKPTEDPVEVENQPDSNNAIHHSSSVSTKDGGAENEEGGEISPRTSAKLKLDELVSEHAHLIQPTSSKEASNIVDENAVITEVPSSEGDRTLEFENLVTTDESTSEPQSSSTASLLDDDDDAKRIPDLPLDNVPLTVRRESEPAQGRKLPTIPTELPVSVEDEKREERRRRAREMLRKHNIGAVKLPSGAGTSPSPSSTKDNKYRQQAIDMLGQVFGTPETVRRVRKPRSEDDDLISGDSTTSFEEGRPKKITRPRSATASTSLQRSARSDSYLRNFQANRTNARTEPQHEPDPPDTRSRSRSFGNSEQHEQDNGSVTTSPAQRHESRPTTIELKADSNKLEKRLSDGQLETTIERTSPSSPTDLPRNRKASPNIQEEKAHKPVTKRSSKTEGSRTSANQKTSPARTGATTTNATNRQRKRAAKPLPTPRPLSDKPSTALKKLTEQKKGESEPTKSSVQTDGIDSKGNDMEKHVKDMEETNDNDVEANHLQNGGIESGPTNGDTIVATTNTSSEMQNVAKVEGSPAKKKTLPSPAWSEHDDELSKDILVTQSEYVKHELIRLRLSLQELEDRASTIETDIRNAMSEGDRELEEDLMKEWFGILNKKNELIKRQMELNFVEKEEDLEKRQFFLNRELRPLMEIPENDKTAAQKDREAHLLRELLELIDERDKLERKRMSTERNSHHSLAATQAEATNVPQRTTDRQNTKDCVIQ